MARKSKRPPGLSENEKAVNLRLRETRERLRLSQEAFAGELRIKRDRLNSYEGLRSALPAELGFNVCANFIIGERWLAQGLGPWRQLLSVAVNYAPPESLRKMISFSNAFPYYEPRALMIINSLKQRHQFIRFSDFLNVYPPKFGVYRRILDAHLDIWIETMTSHRDRDEVTIEFAYRLLNAGNELTEGIIEYRRNLEYRRNHSSGLVGHENNPYLPEVVLALSLDFNVSVESYKKNAAIILKELSPEARLIFIKRLDMDVAKSIAELELRR